jgi:hypothetical protein
MKCYLTAHSNVKPTILNRPDPDADKPKAPEILDLGDDADFFDTPSDSNDLKRSKRNARHCGSVILPDWFINAPPRCKKIIRVLGATVHWNRDTSDWVNLTEIDPGFRMYSNINTKSNMVMKTALTLDDTLQPLIGQSGFIMMVNNYLSEKEFDVTNDNIRDAKFYIRPWDNFTGWQYQVDFIGELEVMVRYD